MELSKQFNRLGYLPKHLDVTSTTGTGVQTPSATEVVQSSPAAAYQLINQVNNQQQLAQKVS